MLRETLCFVVVLVSACRPSTHGTDNAAIPVSAKPINSEPSPSPKPLPGQRIQYQPGWIASFWSTGSYFMTGGEPGNYGILPGEETIADSVYRFWESVRSNWSQSLNHGFIPTDYLTLMPSGFNHIVWTDKTQGQIQGFEKLKTTLSEMQTRCPQLSDKALQAPLEVVWATENETAAPGQFFGNNPLTRFERDRTTFSANLNARPKLNVRAEWFRDMGKGYSYGWRWPDQTFKEQTGGKSWEEGGVATKTLDETFAHEYGHFVLQAWALNHGRNTLQSQWFAESWAELFRAVCWGDIRDNKEWVADEINRKLAGSAFEVWLTSYQNWPHRVTASAEYTLGSIGDVITYKMSRGEYKPEEMFQSMLDALPDMLGVVIYDYPVKSTYDGSMLLSRAPWSLDSLPSILRDAPRLWTRQEFLPAFCRRYDCGKAGPLVDAEAKGLLMDEY